HNPDLVIISGDERIPTKILSYVAHKLNIRVLYFEQGPFGTTILDEIGVNANCSFRGNSNQESSDKKKLMQILEKKEKWLGYKKYRVLDIIHQVLFPSKYPEITKYKLSLAKKNKHPFSVWKTEKNIILLVLQVPEDVNMVCHSPYFENHYDIVKYVYSSIPVGYKLVVREHPLYKNKYESELYDFIAKNNIMIDSAGSLKEKIQKSSLVIVNNSTVGLEAMTYNKSIIVLGNSYYDNPEFTYKFNGENLHDLIITAIVNPKDSNSINQWLNYLFNNQFLSGHFRDKDLSDLKGHVEKICEHLI
ncbi:hypothetical protein J7S63_20290, partial [Providencia rettgeri]|uniref:capsular polysaccharide export protein, LipB/KpsS family n=1 Tax=Providencia rettgeri TaxID=587 RepID=UPI001B36AA6E